MADTDLPDFLKGFEQDLDVDFGFDIVSAEELKEKELHAPGGQTEQVLESNVQGISTLEKKVDKVQGTLSSLKALLDFDELNIEGKLDKILVAVNDAAEEAASAASSAAAAANISPTVDMPEGTIVAEESAITAEKLDKIMAAIGDPEKRKAEVERKLSVAIDEHKDRVNEKLRTIEKLVLPFMYTFIKPSNLEKTYIYWPNRKDVVERQIKKVLAVTRNEE